MGLMSAGGEIRRMSSKEAEQFIKDISPDNSKKGTIITKPIKGKGYYAGTCVSCGKTGDCRRMETINGKLHCQKCFNDLLGQ